MTYDRTNIVEKMRGLIGFRPSYDSSNFDAKLDESLSESYSGQYVNELHDFFTPETFANIAQQFNTFTIPMWSATVTYRKEAVVQHGNSFYQTSVSSLNQVPGAASNWAKTTLLSVWYRNKEAAAILAVVDGLSERRKIEGHGKELKGRTSLFASEGVSSNLVSKSGRFVGLEIDTKLDNILVSVQRLGLQLNGAKQVPIHVIQNNDDQVINLSFDRKNKFHYLDIDARPFLAGNGPFLVGYFEDDLGDVSAIQTVTDAFSEVPCYTCGSVDGSFRRGWDDYITVRPVAIDADDNYTYSETTNFGMNLVMSFRCDFSDLLIREKDSIVPALKAQLKLTLLEAIAATTRNNEHADQTAILAYNQLGDYDDPFNPKIMLNRAFKSLDFELSGMNPMCLPCNNKVRIKHSVI